MKNLDLFSLLLALIFTSVGRAEDVPEKPAEKVAKQFEIVDGTNEIAGEPGQDANGARTKWQRSCDVWKSETKDLNKMNQVVSMSCGSPSCAYQDNGTTICSSTAAYRLKIEGVRAAALAPAQKPAVFQNDNRTENRIETVVTIGPPQMITEFRPQPQVGFIWAPGYWGWSGHRHIWIGNRWSHRGDGWHFEGGHWHQDR